MNFRQIYKSSLKEERAETEDEYKKKVVKHNVWKKWEKQTSENGLPGVETTLSPPEIKAALAYGDPLIEIKDTNGITDASGQIQIINDAKNRKPEAMNYLWLQFQKVTIGYYWTSRIGKNASQARKSKKGMNVDSWNEWLSIAWEDLFNKGDNPTKEIAGVSAIDGFDTSKYKLRTKVIDKNDTAMEAALSNLSQRYGHLLSNSARILNDKESVGYVAGVGKDDEVSVISYNSKDKNDKEIVDSIPYNLNDNDFETVYTDSKETKNFLKRFSQVVKSPELTKKLSTGSNLSEPLIYLLGEPIGGSDKNGLEAYTSSVSDIQRKYPEKDRSQIRNLFNASSSTSLMNILDDYGISQEDFADYAKNPEIMAKMRNIVKGN